MPSDVNVHDKAARRNGFPASHATFIGRGDCQSEIANKRRSRKHARFPRARVQRE